MGPAIRERDVGLNTDLGCMWVEMQPKPWTQIKALIVT